MRLAKYLLMLTYFTYPYYLFPSGGFQPAVAFLVCVFGVLLIAVPKEIIISSTMRTLIIFTVYATLVNTFWYFQSNDISFVVYLVITSFGTFMFITLGNVFNRFNRRDAYLFLFVIFATMATQVILLMMGIVRDVGGGRQTIWFNNPNQLGYFCVLSSTLAIITGYYFRIQSLLIPTIVGLAIFLTALTLSRAALGACVLFVPIILFFSSTLSTVKKLILVIVLAVGSLYVADLFVRSDTYGALERRIERSEAQEGSTSEVRHFDRVWEEPRNLVFGAGKGGYDRFQVPQEIHNLFLSVLFSYGIIGLLLYLVFCFQAIPSLQVLVYMGPVFVYNMTHNGGRVIAFWFLMALVATGVAGQLRARTTKTQHPTPASSSRDKDGRSSDNGTGGSKETRQPIF